MYIIYSKQGCINCERAKNLLTARMIDFELKMAGVDYEVEYLRQLGVRQLPYILKKDGEDLIEVGDFEGLKRVLSNRGWS